MSYFQNFHFLIFSFPEAVFSQNAAFPEFCTLECLISKVFIFRFLASQKLFFSQNAAFPEFCTLECLISKVFIFRFLASQKLFFAKRCISGVLRSGMSYFQSFQFSIFSFPEAFFRQNAAFPEFCVLECYFQSFHFSIFSFPEAFFSQNAAFPEFFSLECLISKVFIFLFLISQKLFFAKRCISRVLFSGTSYFQSFHFSIFSFPEAFFFA